MIQGRRSVGHGQGIPHGRRCKPSNPGFPRFKPGFDHMPWALPADFKDRTKRRQSSQSQPSLKRAVFPGASRKKLTTVPAGFKIEKTPHESGFRVGNRAESDELIMGECPPTDRHGSTEIIKPKPAMADIQLWNHMPRRDDP